MIIYLGNCICFNDETHTQSKRKQYFHFSKWINLNIKQQKSLETAFKLISFKTPKTKGER